MSESTPEPATEPATSAGHTEAAGAGLSDEEMATDVSEQTDPNQQAEDVFEREAAGTSDDTEAAKGGGEHSR